MSTLCVMAVGFTSLLTLYRISKPFNLLRTVVYIAMVILLSGGIFFFPDFFGLQHFSWELFVFMLIFLMAGYGLFNIMFNIFHDRTDMIANFRGWLAEQKAWFREKKWKKKKTG